MAFIIVAAVAVIAILARSAYRNGGSEPLFFVGNLAGMWVLSAMLFGYPGVIVPALMVVPAIFVMLILITRAS